jgi:hypothetical protein
MISRAFVLFLVGVVGLAAACSSLQKAEAPGVRLFECAATAFLPIAGSYERASEVVRDVQSGRVVVQDVLDAAQATKAEATKLESDLRACVSEAKGDSAPDAGAAE